MIHLEFLPDDIFNNIYRNFLISFIACDLKTLLRALPRLMTVTTFCVCDVCTRVFIDDQNNCMAMHGGT